MELLVILLGSIALCAVGGIAQHAADNRHYVLGVSRYIWIPDDRGVPHLVDLLDESEAFSAINYGAYNQYRLYTRKNPYNPQILVHGNERSVWNSHWRWNRPIKVIVHGWRSNGDSQVNELNKMAFLQVEDCNVIVVDWSRAAKLKYTSSVRQVPGIGQYLGYFMEWLLSSVDGHWSEVHLVGHSLGAHVVGYAGRTMRGQPYRITGLDPAGPKWESRPDALNRSSGVYVECIHTNAGVLGMMTPTCDADFYPNGGRSQSGCFDSICSHMRSYLLFASSVQTNQFVGRQCLNLRQAGHNECGGSVLNMGNNQPLKYGNGIYALSTGNTWPF